MKVDQRFHCFGCGEDGDVIDFTAKLFNLSPTEAAKKLEQDFGLIYDSQAPPRRRYVRQKTEAQKFREDRQRCYRVPVSYTHLDVYKRQGMGGLILEGTEAKILSDVVAQFYAYLSGSMFNDPVGMAIYAELHYICLLYTSRCV